MEFRVKRVRFDLRENPLDKWLKMTKKKVLKIAAAAAAATQDDKANDPQGDMMADMMEGDGDAECDGSMLTMSMTFSDDCEAEELDDRGWTEQMANEFLEGCVGDEGYCACVLDNIMTDFDPSDLESWDQDDYESLAELYSDCLELIEY